MKQESKFFVFNEGLAALLLAQGKTSEEVAGSFIEANKREDKLEHIAKNIVDLLKKNRKD